jgi:asparagine synthase (glutamine-hydrolysing)
VSRLVRGLPGRTGRYARRTFLALEPTPRDLFFENFAVFPLAAQRALLADPLLQAARDPYADMLARWNEGEGDSLLRMSRTDLQTYLVELLMKQDQMSMAASVESRVPFLDDAFVERVLAMPSRLKLRGLTTKAVLRAALRGRIPPAILSRPKMGFPVPIGDWLRRRFWPLVSEFVLSERALDRRLFRADAVAELANEHRLGGGHGDRLWLLVNLEVWQRVFLDGDDVPAVTQTMRSLCESSG